MSVEQSKDTVVVNLQTRINELLKELSDLKASAEDSEKEAAAAIEREQGLMEEAGIWKHQTEVYKKENDHLTESLEETQKYLKKSQGDLILAKAFIKAVL